MCFLFKSKLRKRLETLVKDECNTDEYIRQKALEVLEYSEVYGDTYGIPSLEDIVDLLVEQAKER